MQTAHEGCGMVVLTVNTGSSSVRLAIVVAETASDLRAGGAARHEAQGSEPRERLTAFLDRHAGERPRLAAHRVVHGGARLTGARRIGAAVEAEIERLVPLAPLHNPPALAWIRACREVLGDEVPQVAVFDTAFFADLPEVARAYALPRALCERHGIRRYGFHGLAHRALWARWRELNPNLAEGGKVVSFQLGAGCSVAAIERGRPLDTSMGFSPLEGLVMATRSGDVDPGLLLYLQRIEGLSPEGLERLLNEQSGLRGISGVSGDMRGLLASSEPAARLAVALYGYRARKYLGAYLAALGGADGVLFGGGVGENAAAVRAGILAGFEWAGLRLDAAANAAALGREARISDSRSRIAAWVIPVDEARVLAAEALAAVAA
jgi:acetate kinase